MALETGTYISDLNVSNPVNTDGVTQADDHLRLLKSTIKATFPNVTGAVTPTHTDLNKLSSTGNPQFATIELGAASDTTLSRVSAGLIAVEGKPVVMTTGGQTIEHALGAVGTPSLTATGDTNTGFWFPAADTIAASTGGSERVRVDSSGNVGIGRSANYTLDVYRSGTTTATIAAANDSVVNSLYAAGSTAGGVGTVTSHPLLVITANTEQARFDTSGNFLLGLTSTISGSDTLQVENAAGDSTQIRLRHSSSTAGNHWRIGSDNVNTVYVINHNSAGVYVTNGATSWSALSDERMKDIIEPITDAVEKVSGLRAVIGKYKTDEVGVRRSFLIAQDVQAVLPEAVSVSNPETGNLGLSYTEVIPLLVAAIKEQRATITSLETRVAVLEAS